MYFFSFLLQVVSKLGDDNEAFTPPWRVGLHNSRSWQGEGSVARRSEGGPRLSRPAPVHARNPIAEPSLQRDTSHQFTSGSCYDSCHSPSPWPLLDEPTSLPLSSENVSLSRVFKAGTWRHGTAISLRATGWNPPPPPPTPCPPQKVLTPQTHLMRWHAFFATGATETKNFLSLFFPFSKVMSVPPPPPCPPPPGYHERTIAPRPLRSSPGLSVGKVTIRDKPR